MDLILLFLALIVEDLAVGAHSSAY